MTSGHFDLMPINHKTYLCFRPEGGNISQTISGMYKKQKPRVLYDFI